MPRTNRPVYSNTPGNRPLPAERTELTQAFGAEPRQVQRVLPQKTTTAAAAAAPAAPSGGTGPVAAAAAYPSITLTGAAGLSVNGTVGGGDTQGGPSPSFALGALVTAALLKGDNAGGITGAVAGTDYIAPYGSIAANLFLGGPASGAAAAPAFRAIASADLPIATTGAVGAVKPDGTTITIDGTGKLAASGGSGLPSPGTSGYHLVSNGSAWVADSVLRTDVAGGSQSASVNSPATAASTFTVGNGSAGSQIGLNVVCYNGGSLPAADVQRWTYDNGSTQSVKASVDKNWNARFPGLYLTGIASVSAAYTAALTDAVILANAATAAFTVTLPTAVGNTGRLYTIKKVDSGANVVTVGTTSSQTIDGATTYTGLSAQNASLTVISDGSNWRISGTSGISSGGGSVPTGTAGQTLYYNTTPALAAASNLKNDGTNLTVATGAKFYFNSTAAPHYFIINSGSELDIGSDSSGIFGMRTYLQSAGTSLWNYTFAGQTGNANSRFSVTPDAVFSGALSVSGAVTLSGTFSAPGQTPVRNEVPAGSVNGTNTAFTLAHSPSAAGISLYMGTSATALYRVAPTAYTLMGTSLTMGAAPASGSLLYVDYEY